MPAARHELARPASAVAAARLGQGDDVGVLLRGRAWRSRRHRGRRRGCSSSSTVRSPAALVWNPAGVAPRVASTAARHPGEDEQQQRDAWPARRRAGRETRAMSSRATTPTPATSDGEPAERDDLRDAELRARGRTAAARRRSAGAAATSRMIAAARKRRIMASTGAYARGTRTGRGAPARIR